MSGDIRHNIKYIYELPYMERMELCRILDQNDKWEDLGGIYLGFDMLTIQSLRRCRGPSATDELLTKWGHQNHTILELFIHLSKMQHYQAMLKIKKFVEPEYHKLIYEGEGNLSRMLPRNTQSLTQKSSVMQEPLKSTLSTGTNINLDVTESSKMLPSTSLKTESKILNIDTNGDDNACHAPTTALPSPLARVPSSSPTPGELPRGDSSRSRARSDVSILDTQGPPQILFKELEMATNGWDVNSILGKGGFGTVYKGVWKNTPVAIKRTRNPETDESHSVQIQQILGELRMLNVYRHDNILPLYGYSVGGDDPCLIYQFMPNGSLEDRLLCRQNTPPLSWHQRLVIAVGTARGLQFLHTINEKPLIHGDIKSANILIDSNFQPKIGDFGLAREGPQNQYTHMKVSRVHGTRPYLPDEFLRAKKFSTKVDTHSFGVVLFEIGTGLRAYDDQRTHKFLRDLIENTVQLEILIDKKCEPEELHTYTELIKLGKCCVQRRPKDRPEMVLVLQDLEALMTEREIMVKAQHMVRRISPVPANPYEAQLLYDHLSQQRNTSAVSNGMDVAGAEANNPSSARLHNKGIVPPHILKRIQEAKEEKNLIVPSIAVSPPSLDNPPVNIHVNSENGFSNGSSSSSDDGENATNPTPNVADEHTSFNTMLPLISVLGVKNKTATRTEAPSSFASNTESEIFGPIPWTVQNRPSTTNENVEGNIESSSNSTSPGNSFKSTKEKKLWILDST